MASKPTAANRPRQSAGLRVPPQVLSPSSSSASSRIPCARPSGCCAAQHRIHYPSNFKRSAAPARVMFYQGGAWNDVPNRVRELLRSGFLARKAVVSAEIDGSTLLFDFLRMLQIDPANGSQRSIAWIDENGKCFFPVAFISENLEDGSGNMDNNPDSPKIIKIDNRADVAGRVLGKRKAADVADEEEVTSAERRHSEWPNVKVLREEEWAYNVRRNLFLSGMMKVDPAASVAAIHQCVGSGGPLDRARVEVFRKQVEITKAARGGSANVVQAWFGASAGDIRGILTHGFGAPGKVSGPQAYGVGLHLSHLSVPHLSAEQSERDENGERHVVLCRIILGNVEKVEAGSKQCYPSSVEFDTGADDPQNPKWYVVWSTNMNRHVIPECLVSFKYSAAHVPAQLGVPGQKTYPLGVLISRVQRHLPPYKVREVYFLLHEHAAGRRPKDDFYKQLRIVIGNELMLSVIQEFRGPKQGSS